MGKPNGFRGETGSRGRGPASRGRTPHGPERLESRQLLATFGVPLANASFESPDLSPGAPFAAGVEGWTTTGGVGTTYESAGLEASPATDGDQYVIGDSSNWSLRQTGPTIAAGTRYVLKVDLYPLTSGSSSASVLLRNANTGAILGGVSTFASGNPVIREVDAPEGEWTTLSVGFNSDLVAGDVGAPLEVRINGARFAVDNVRLEANDSPRDFYISSSGGDASNDGTNASAPFASFGELAAYGPLLPGDNVYLKAGDVFSEELNLRGKGTADELITVGRYGDGPNPILRPDDLEFGRGLVWNNASHAVIRGIDVERSKIGFYLRYEFDDPGGENVLIEDAHFRDLSDPTLDPPKHNFEYAWSDAIWVGGQAWNEAEFATRLDGLTIRNVSSVNAAHLFGTGWYFPAPYKSRVTNLLIEDAVAYDNLSGAFQLFGVDGGVIRRVHSVGGGGQDTWSGTTLGFVQNAQNLLIEDSEFAYIDRAQSADGTGMDFEGDTDNVTFRNNVVHNNAGSGLLILSTQGRHTNLLIEDNVFYNNARDPWNSEINSEAQGSNDNHTGIIRNNSFYRGDPSINFFSPNSDWSGFQISGNKLLEYEDVRTRPTRWEFDAAGDFEGWGGFNQWGDASVGGGVLSGTSTGGDPFVHSPPTWANSGELPYAWVRMSQSPGGGGAAQLFYITETDPVWTGDKSAPFNVVADGQMHDYFVDLGAVTRGNEVITQVRIDPAFVAGADFEIDFLRLTDSTDPDQPPPAAALPAPQSTIFTSIAFEDGHVLESAQDSGVGGSVSNGEWTFRLGDDASNRAYRQFLSFDTSTLPDDAIVVEATLGITRIGNPVGTIPIGVADSEWGSLFVDLAAPGFGSSFLTGGDWQAAATEEAVSRFAWPAYSNGQTIYSRLDDQHTPLVSTEDRTQFRVRYENDDDGDFTADYMSYATSNHPSSSLRPTLDVKYYVPNGLSGDYDQNGVVDDADFGVWSDNYGATFGPGMLADGNGDGRVDAADYSVWRDNHGAALPASSVALATAPPSIVEDEPEPAEPSFALAPTDRVAPTFAVPRLENPVTIASVARRDLLLVDRAVLALEDSQSDSESLSMGSRREGDAEDEEFIDEAVSSFGAL